MVGVRWSVVDVQGFPACSAELYAYAFLGVPQGRVRLRRVDDVKQFLECGVDDLVLRSLIREIHLGVQEWEHDQLLRHCQPCVSLPRCYHAPRCRDAQR